MYYRFNPIHDIYDNPELYYEVIRILEKICNIDFHEEQPYQERLAALNKVWIRHDNIEVTPLKLASATLGIPEDALEAMLVHPDLPLVVSELEAYTSVDWVDQDEELPKQWTRKIPPPKYVGGDYEEKSLLGLISEQHYPILSEDEWSRHIENLYPYVRGRNVEDRRFKRADRDPAEPPPSSPRRTISPTIQQGKIITLSQAFGLESMAKAAHGEWPKFIAEILGMIYEAGQVNGVGSTRKTKCSTSDLKYLARKN